MKVGKKYIYVIFVSVWPLLPNSLDCSRNIYGAVIRVIYPRKESLPLENGGKYKAWFALSSSLSPFTGTVSESGLDTKKGNWVLNS